MLKFIIFNGLIKGFVVWVLTNFMFAIVSIVSLIWWEREIAEFIKFPVVLPIVCVFISYFIKNKITFKEGIYLSLTWFILFVALEFFQVLFLEHYFQTISTNSLIILALTTLVPIGVAGSYSLNLRFGKKLQSNH